VRRPTSDPLDGPSLDAILPLGQGDWDSTRPLLVEGPCVTVLVTSRQAGQPGASDVSFTVVPTADDTPSLDSLAVTLTGSAANRQGRLDRLGRCLIRDVPDARYALHLRPVSQPGDSQDHHS
jgi:hypothetical protein